MIIRADSLSTDLQYGQQQGDKETKVLLSVSKPV